MRVIIWELEGLGLQAWLRAGGHDVEGCTSPEGLLGSFRAREADLVILDLEAEGLDVRACLPRVRALPGGAWSVAAVVAGAGHQGPARDAVHWGADDVLLRGDGPAGWSVRLAILERLLADRRAWRGAVQSLARTEEELRGLLDTIPDAVLRVHHSGRICAVNAPAERLTGYRRDELIGRSIEVLVPQTQRAVHVAKRTGFLERLAPAGRPLGTDLDLNLQRKDGTQVPVDIALSLHTEGGQDYAVAAVRDITERRSLEAKLRRTTEVAERSADRMRRDVQAAARIQRGLLPVALPSAPGYCFGWEFYPCEDLGGDGLNVFRLDPEHLGLYLLDVSGHGVTAALLAVALARLLTTVEGQSTVVRTPAGITAPAEVVRQLNHWFFANPTFDQFFTAVYGVLHEPSGRLRYVSAGHPNLLLARSGEAPGYVPGEGIPVGIKDGQMFPEQELTLAPGDRLFLYSDGLIEALDPMRKLFGAKRLRDTVQALTDHPLHEAVLYLVARVQAWAAVRTHDDVSLLAVERAR